MNRRFFLYFLLWLPCLPLTIPEAVADIAPTGFVSGGISPIDASDIRMLSATVDIEWGTPCTLSAVFVLDNQADRPAEIQLGFPVPVPVESRGNRGPLNLGLTFDDVPAAPADITQVGSSLPYDQLDCLWFRCKHTFAPGHSRVTVTTKLPPTLAYGRAYVENLYYVIGTGAFWKGTIGSEEVTIHFPEPVTPAQILNATPKDYTIEGNTVRWRFTDFEPHGEDHDISLRYLRPDVVPELTRLRAQIAKNPADTRATLTLVKNLFALCPRKQFYGEPKGEMDASEFQEIMNHLASQQDRAAFEKYHEKQLNGSYRINLDARAVPSWTDIVGRLNRSGYVPRDPLPVEASEAKALIERLLKEHPHNAEAWSVYLVNYRHIHYASSYHNIDKWFVPLDKELIEQAYRNCPTDPFIQLLWSKRAWFAGLMYAEDESKAALRRRFAIEKKLSDALEAHAVNATSFRRIDYGYY